MTWAGGSEVKSTFHADLAAQAPSLEPIVEEENWFLKLVL